MHKNLIKEPQSSFLSCEKDTEIILRKLFVDSKPHSDVLKKLLTIPMKDCLAKDGKNAILYNEKVKNMGLSQLIKDGYIITKPRVDLTEHEEVKSYIAIHFDEFTPNEQNPQFRDCTVVIAIMCHTQYWNIDDYQSRPLKIAGYIDGILRDCKLSGIGELIFAGANEISFGPNFAGYCLVYNATHGVDDIEEVDVIE